MVQIDNAPWFIAADVCKALGIRNTVHAEQVSVAESDSKRLQIAGQRGLGTYPVRAIKGPPNLSSIQVLNCRGAGTKGRPNKIVSEAGLYQLVLQSDKPEAKTFHAQVTREVPPTIRKDGASKYSTADFCDPEIDT
ncbi:Bro-N domain-containing protein [Rhodobacter lacus]|uniref:Bro-N domain-containing protein n=1 Tax=Rhodobacter lacus TaxID=1641972 RepID=A0ABW5AD14_9RHOB